MRVHGYGQGLVPFLLMLAAFLLSIVFVVVAIGCWCFDRPSAPWWWSALTSFGISFGLWLYL